MSIYHCSIKIISRSSGRSAVASAAYRSGEKLVDEETGLVHDYTNKGGVIINEIILPANAPGNYADRAILWNEVQKTEKRSDAQLAREVEVALPVELTREEQIECVRAYIRENFVEKGMIADWALHDKGDGNPHAHIMLTVRGFDENKNWKQKQRTVFANAVDEKGKAVYNPELPVYDSKNREATSQYRIPKLDKNGKQATRKRQGKGTEYLWEKISIPENDWSDRSLAEAWRKSWADHCNRYLDPEHRIDHRSYKRQGIEQIPTIHEGVTARKIEAEGQPAERCQINREIREHNILMQQMKKLTEELRNLIILKARALYERYREFRGSAGTVESSGGDNIQAFFRKLNAAERASEEKRDHNIPEWADYGAERERADCHPEQADIGPKRAASERERAATEGERAAQGTERATTETKSETTAGYTENKTGSRNKTKKRW